MIFDELACKNGYKFKSVMGEGKIVFIEERSHKVSALNKIMLHMTGKEFDIPEKATGGVAVLKLRADVITAKERAK